MQPAESEPKLSLPYISVFVTLDILSQQILKERKKGRKKERKTKSVDFSQIYLWEAVLGKNVQERRFATLRIPDHHDLTAAAETVHG